MALPYMQGFTWGQRAMAYGLVSGETQNTKWRLESPKHLAQYPES